MGVLAPADVHADIYVPAFRDLDVVEFVGIADDEAGWGRAAAERHDAPLLPTGDLLGRVDAVAVFSTYTDRGQWIAAATDAGVDVLCELPLATTVADARTFVETCRDAGSTLGMITPLRFGDPMQRAKGLVESGAVGTVEAITARNRCAFRNRDVDGWSADPEHADGGSVVHHSEHTVDVARWLTGAEFDEVYAELGSQRDLPVDDVNVISARLTDGTAFTTDTSWTTPDSDEFWGESEVDVVGSDGTLEVDQHGESARLVRDAKSGGGGEDGDSDGDGEPGGTGNTEADGISQRHFGPGSSEALVRDFVEAVESGRDPLANGIDGLRQVEVIEAVYESAETGQPVRVGRWSPQ